MRVHDRVRPGVFLRSLVILALMVIASPLVFQTTISQTKIPETIVLAKESKLGQVTFNHLKHITEQRSPDLKSKITCVDCHHVAQPAAEAVKHPPHRTAWPPDRTTTLTAELIEKFPATVVPVCGDCHARADAKPKLMPEIPTVKFEGAAEPTVMTKQQAFHHVCGDCHDAVVKVKPDSTGPGSKKCLTCHKKFAA